jgi:hypothetical protein
MIKLRIAQKETGTLEMNIPAKNKLIAYEEDEAVYEG